VIFCLQAVLFGPGLVSLALDRVVVGFLDALVLQFFELLVLLHGLVEGLVVLEVGFDIGFGDGDAVDHLVDVLEYLLQVLDRVFFAFFTLFAFFGLFAFFALVRLLLAGGRLVALSALLLGLQRRNRRADAHHG